MKLMRALAGPSLLLIVVLINSSFIDLTNYLVRFRPYWGDEPLVQNRNYYSASMGDSVKISTCRFYISDFTLVDAHDMSIGSQKYKLVDLFDSVTSDFQVSGYANGPVTTIKFNLGIDSTTNVAGVGEGDLDPTKGMYWSWQSGYINMKLEGNSPVCKKSRGEFQYHIGGYSGSNNSLTPVKLDVINDNGEYVIHVDLAKYFNHVDMAQNSNVMSPSPRAVQLAGYAATMFSIEK